MKTLVYLTGEPGAGKSTLMAELTAGCERVPSKDGLVRWDVLLAPGIDAVELGVRRGMFSGTDGLGMAVAPEARAWISRCRYRLVLAEGDRLSSMSFLASAIAGGYAIELVVCEPPEIVAAERRNQRGTTQNASWVIGRRTKTHRFADTAEQAGYRVTRLDTSCAPHEAAARLRDEVEVLRWLP